MVYPGERGPVESIRLKVLNEALQDLRALKLLESLIGRQRTVLLLQEEAEEITFKSYPRHPEWLLEKRERINLIIRDLA